jgi:hypothetical protein
MTVASGWISFILGEDAVSVTAEGGAMAEM